MASDTEQQEVVRLDLTPTQFTYVSSCVVLQLMGLTRDAAGISMAKFAMALATMAISEEELRGLSNLFRSTHVARGDDRA